MAYQCPRCSQPVQRGHSTGANIAAGLVGALFYAAFGSFQCKNCGKISQSEFPPETRSKMRMGSILLVICAVALLCLVLWLISQRP